MGISITEISAVMEIGMQERRVKGRVEKWESGEGGEWRRGRVEKGESGEGGDWRRGF